MKKSPFLTLCLCVAVAASLATLGHAADKPITITYSALNMAFPFQAFIAKAAQAEGKKLGINLLVIDGQGSSSTQSSGLRNAVNQGVDGIVLNANDVNALVPAVNEVISADVPIVTVDSSIGGAKKPVPHFGPDNVAGGAKMAQYVIDRFPDGAKIILLQGQPGSGPAIQRAQGVHETLKKAGEMVTQNLINSLGYTPDAILASNDDMALGALSALQQLGVPKGKVMVLGFDAVPEALKKIREGELTATVDQLPGEQVANAIGGLVSHLKEKKPLEGSQLDPILIDKDNRYSEVK
jgi:inositol transport system substrate-binding protein